MEELQVGGGKPSIDNLPKINLFNNHHMESYLSPVLGFYFIESEAINNYYHFGDSEYIIASLVREKIYHRILDNIRLSHSLGINDENKDIVINEIGIFMAQRYYNRFVYLEVNKCLVEIKEALRRIGTAIGNLLRNLRNFDLIPALIEEIKRLYPEEVNIARNDVDLFPVLYSLYDELIVEFMNSKNLLEGINEENFRQKINEWNEIIKEIKNKLNKVNISFPGRSFGITKIISSFNNTSYDDDTEFELNSVILSVLWWLANDRIGIRKYYEGFNEGLESNFFSKELKVEIPLDFEEIKVVDDRSFTFLLKELYLKAKPKIPMQDYGNVNVLLKEDHIWFPDCVETSLRNFIQLLIFKDGIYQLEILRELGAKHDVIDFFRIYNTPEINNSETQKEMIISNNVLQLTARQAWGLIMCNLEGVQYAKHYKGFNCEIKARVPGSEMNILKAIKQLFSNISSWDDLNRMFDLNLVVITTKEPHEINFTIDALPFNWKIYKHHSLIVQKYFEDSADLVDYNVDLPYKQFIVKTFKKVLPEEINPFVKDFNSRWFMYQTYKNSFDKVKLVNKYHAELNNSTYSNLLQNIFNTNNADLVSMVNLRLEKVIVNPRVDFFMKYYGVKFREDSQQNVITSGKLLMFFYNSPLSKLFIENIEHLELIDEELIELPPLPNLKSLKINLKVKLENQLDNLVNLQYLHLGEYFNDLLGDSLDRLINLKKLIFGKYFNKELNDSLNKLVNLEQIVFDGNFNKKLNDSLNNLTSLKEIYFSKFDQSLDTSLTPLRNLRKIVLGSEFNQDLESSLDGLDNLEELNLGFSFNKPLNLSLNKLRNLKTLIIGPNFKQRIGRSLNNLTELKSLKFKGLIPNDFHENCQRLINLDDLEFDSYGVTPLELGNLNTVFAKLTRLKSLRIGKCRNKINNLQNLINLKKLLLGRFFPGIDFGLNEIRKLVNLEELFLGNEYNDPLGSKLKNMKNLKVLKIGDDFNRYLGESLKENKKLEKLFLGNSFNQPLEESLVKNKNLELLMFGNNFNQSLGKSFKKLTNLKSLIFGEKFNKPLDRSLDYLESLTGLIFYNFNFPIGSSFEKLSNLRILKFKRIYNHPFGNSLDNLVNLEHLEVNHFNKPIGDSFNNLVNLKILKLGNYNNELNVRIFPLLQTLEYQNLDFENLEDIMRVPFINNESKEILIFDFRKDDILEGGSLIKDKHYLRQYLHLIKNIDV